MLALSLAEKFAIKSNLKNYMWYTEDTFDHTFPTMNKCALYNTYTKVVFKVVVQNVKSTEACEKLWKPISTTCSTLFSLCKANKCSSELARLMTRLHEKPWSQELYLSPIKNFNNLNEHMAK